MVGSDRMGVRVGWGNMRDGDVVVGELIVEWWNIAQRRYVEIYSVCEEGNAVNDEQRLWQCHGKDQRAAVVAVSIVVSEDGIGGVYQRQSG